MQGGLYLILLDNMEDYLAEGDTVREEDLRLFLEHCLVRPSGARLIVTSRVQVNVISAGLHNVRIIPLGEGLSEDDAASLLRDLDKQGILGLRDALEEDLGRAARSTKGIPRALEILAGILHRDPTASLNEILEDDAPFGEEVVEMLVAEGYQRLDEEERRVIEALAVFDRPVAEKAISYILHPWFPDLDVRTSLRRLVNSYFVSVTRATREYSLHPLDREYAYQRLSDDEKEGTYSRCNLELRAADFYASIRKPEDEWKSMDDLAPQLAEFEHRVCAGDGEGAGQILLNSISGALYRWGHYLRLAAMSTRLRRQLTAPISRARNLHILSLIHLHLGKVEQSVEDSEQALTIYQDIGHRRGEVLAAGHLGFAYCMLGQIDRGIKQHKRSLAISREIGDRSLESHWLGCLGNAYIQVGQIEDAIESFEEALGVALESDDLSERGLWLGYLGCAYVELGEAWRAIKLCEEALDIARKVKDHRRQGLWLGHLGQAYLALALGLNSTLKTT
jgi:tetratricopeptide (TPR) repeat protein